MEEALIRRVLPHSLETGQSVIGSMFMDRETVTAAPEIVTGSDFYQQQCDIMFDAVVGLSNEGKPVDLVTLQDRLKEKDVSPEVSSLDLVWNIVTMVLMSASVGSYAAIVGKKAALRRLIKTTGEIANTYYVGRESLENILADTEKSVFNLLQNREGQDFAPIKQVAINVPEKIEDVYKNQGTVAGIPSSFIGLNYKFSGFQPPDLILIAAHSSVGKTTFILNVVDYVAARKSLSCMVLSLEMFKKQLVNCTFSMEPNVDSRELRTDSLTDSNQDTMVEGIGAIGNSKLIIDDTPGISISKLRPKCRKIKLEYGLNAVIIDCPQLMSGSKKDGGDNCQWEISNTSRSLKALVRELRAPATVLPQLPCAYGARQDHRLILSDLRKSEAIEQDVDVVMFLYRDDCYNKDTGHPNEAEIIIARQHNGSIGAVTLIWKPECIKFMNAAGPQGGGQDT